MMTGVTPSGLGDRYLETRHRVDRLLRGLPDERWLLPVPACPGWRVRDVVAHLYGNIEDGAAGRITGPPDAALTGEQVERHRAAPPELLLDRWAEAAPLMADAIDRSSLWPALIDAVTHEHDLRHALDQPGARDEEVVGAIAGVLAEGMASSVPAVRVDLGDTTYGPVDADLVLATTSFELMRSRLGRRTRAEVAALDWSVDPPDEVLDRYFVFGPAAAPLGE